ncbi:cobyric acid synthase [Corynebacterium sp. HMSC073D01]|uniref:cobyric acid synthase n=1 Tax=Corynebacterium sp. HMSC073D01 TaxID=1739536 RepID=UPI0008A2EA78|nr:cobyric acid synthase [Corynebacterium sp. HMSC073D01]OFO43722.1 cobyric acid synthase CobQ [Corynebacterium sp. HMSC073D01]
MSAVLICGTTSDAGKSVLVAGLCRALARRGVSVAPFKAQNMSNNSAVCPTGGEIGRAQALQAFACGLEPEVRFNPVLLKPGSDRRSQVVVLGRVEGDVGAKDYFTRRTRMREVAAETLRELEREYDIVVCEGAGSPAETNLRATDVANFGLAEACDLDVYVVGDIDRGGVLAHLFGTYHIVDEADRARIKGFIINKFRGDPDILQPGLDDLYARTGVPTIGILPFIDGLWIDAEDSLQSAEGRIVGLAAGVAPGEKTISVAAVRLPRVSNATDVEALAAEPATTVTWTSDPGLVRSADLVVVPGSKSTVTDLEWMRGNGIADALCQRTGPILAICGGYQMLGKSIEDDVESHRGKTRGLGLFDLDIAFHPEKTLKRWPDGTYEIHHGRVARNGDPTWLDGEGSCVRNLWGTHRHGVMDDDERRKDFLSEVFSLPRSQASSAGERMKQVDLLADAVEEHLDMDAFISRYSRNS